jgi:hypothetical protein
MRFLARAHQPNLSLRTPRLLARAARSSSRRVTNAAGHSGGSAARSFSFPCSLSSTRSSEIHGKRSPHRFCRRDLCDRRPPESHISWCFAPAAAFSCPSRGPKAARRPASRQRPLVGPRARSAASGGYAEDAARPRRFWFATVCVAAGRRRRLVRFPSVQALAVRPRFPRVCGRRLLVPSVAQGAGIHARPAAAEPAAIVDP